MIRLYGLLFLVNLALLVIALIDCLSSEEYEVRNLPKVVWVFIILLFSPIGPIVWFVAGRPQKSPLKRGGTWRPGGGFPEAERPRPVAPDDDDEFLRNVDPGSSRNVDPQSLRNVDPEVQRNLRRDDERLLSEWEADLRRREEELRRRGDNEPS